jgi:hypothetical protein
MIQIEDYTALPEGQLVPLEGRVERCPRCGRKGIEERPTVAAPYFLHVQTSEVLPDGLLEDARDCCPLSLPS